MKQNSADVAKVLAEPRRSMRRWPETGVVAGIVNIGEHKVDHLIGTVDFTAVHYAALADTALERAIERMAAMAEPPRDLIMQCERARAALDFEDMAQAA